MYMCACVLSLRNFIYYTVLEIDSLSTFHSLPDIKNALLPQFLFVFVYVFSLAFCCLNLPQ